MKGRVLDVETAELRSPFMLVAGSIAVAVSVRPSLAVSILEALVGVGSGAMTRLKGPEYASADSVLTVPAAVVDTEVDKSVLGSIGSNIRGMLFGLRWWPSQHSVNSPWGSWLRSHLNLLHHDGRVIG